MKNKGFTLIELLAVIVILAIIALIATPIILGIINDARTQAKKRSAELVYTGVQYAYTSAMYGGTEGTTVGEVDLSDIAANFSTENAEVKNPTKISDDNMVKIQTKDNVYCKVEDGANGGFIVTCGDKADYTGNNLLAAKNVTGATQ